MKIIENNWMNLINLLKNILIITKILYDLRIKEKIFNELVEEKSVFKK